MTAAAAGRRPGRPLIDMTGRTYGRLEVIERAGNIGGKPAWKCVCKCGNPAVVEGYALRTGKIRSCGCLQAEKAGAVLTENHKRARAEMAAWRKLVGANLVSMNELLVELTAKVSPDESEFIGMVHDQCRDFSWALGFEFRGERAPTDWEFTWPG